MITVLDKNFMQKMDAIAKAPIKPSAINLAPIKSDVLEMTPAVKKSLKSAIKKFDNPNFFEKACRFISKTKIGKTLVFGAIAIAAAITGKSIADNAEKAE